MFNTEMNSIIEKIVKECSKHYGFDSEEAMMRLGLKSDCLVKEVVKDVVVEEEKKSKNKKIVLPYNNEYDNLCCSGLELNHGLYTQCPKKKKVNDLCEGCNKQALNNSHGKPDYGRIEERQEIGLMDFRDPKGKSPVSYIKIMKKLGLTKEEVLEEAKKRNKKMDEIHFMEEEDKKKGRPKKSKKELEVEGETNDLFAELVASSSTNVVPTLEVKKISQNPSPKEKSPKKLQTTPRLEEESPSPKEKSPKEKSPKEKSPKEKSPKEKVVKEKVVKEKSPKEKVVKEKVVKEKKEKVVKEKKEEINLASTCSEKEEVKEEEEEEEADVVKRFEHEGIKYLKSKKSGIIYNMEQEVIGKWNEELQKIDLNEATEEEEEEEYDE